MIPCGLIFIYAFFERGVYGGIDYVFTFENFGRALSPLYLEIFLNSAKIAGLATLIAISAGLSGSGGDHAGAKRWQTVLLILVIMPFWSNYLIRTYAWIVMLNNEGLINGGLRRHRV